MLCLADQPDGHPAQLYHALRSLRWSKDSTPLAGAEASNDALRLLAWALIRFNFSEDCSACKTKPQERMIAAMMIFPRALFITGLLGAEIAGDATPARSLCEKLHCDNLMYENIKSSLFFPCSRIFLSDEVPATCLFAGGRGLWGTGSGAIR